MKFEKSLQSYLERSSSSFSFVCEGCASTACSAVASAPASSVGAFLRPGIDGIWGIETVGIETVGIETDGKLDGNQPDTLPVTLENIPPAALVGLGATIKCNSIFRSHVLDNKHY